jgi:ribonuclease R
MRDRVGEELDGTIAGVASFGFFVQVEVPFIEGLVKVQTLGDDNYELDEETQRLSGRRTGRTFALGDRVRVVIENVSVQRRKIDFALISHDASAAPSPPQARGRRERERKREKAAPRPRSRRR